MVASAWTQVRLLVWKNFILQVGSACPGVEAEVTLRGARVMMRNRKEQEINKKKEKEVKKEIKKRRNGRRS